MPGPGRPRKTVSTENEKPKDRFGREPRIRKVPNVSKKTGQIDQENPEKEEEYYSWVDWPE